jgi:glycosyltransferase involved in cell wall biosynthesis
MTSHREGSPVIIKEAMACGTPIVSVDVGDVKEVLADVDGCFISTYDANNIATHLKQALKYDGKTNGPQSIIEKELSNELVVKKIIEIYNNALKKK